MLSEEAVWCFLIKGPNDSSLFQPTPKSSLPRQTTMASIEPAVFNSPHFTWQDPYLYINTTDSDGSQEPPEDTETSVSLFSGDPKCDQKIKMWKDKLGQTLVEDLLAIPLGQKGKML